MYRDDRDTLLARIARLERELAEARAVAAPRPRPRLFARAAVGEIVVLRQARSLRFLEAGERALAFGWLGVMPAAGAPVELEARGVPCRDGELDVDVYALVSIAPTYEGRSRAARYFLDVALPMLTDVATPFVDRALRAAAATRARDGKLELLADDTRVTAQSALTDVGLEIGDVMVAPPGGLVRRA